jgi:hypothetical protein
LYRWAIAGLLGIGCGGALGGPITGGESHFLGRCDSTCESGLDCISGVCTRGCLVKEAKCSDLAPSALCTAGSIEPGAVAVCDVSCTNDAGCKEVGPEHRCESGFCRGPEPVSGGQTCRVAKVDYPSGAQNIPAPSGCGTCSCNDGALVCTDQACSVGMPILECPEGVSSDPITVVSSELVGPSLTLEVSHGGGCSREPSFALCYGPGFLES